MVRAFEPEVLDTGYTSLQAATPLHVACRLGNVRAVKMLLEIQHIEPNKLARATVSQGWTLKLTPLELVLQRTNSFKKIVEIVESLLDDARLLVRPFELLSVQIKV